MDACNAIDLSSQSYKSLLYWLTYHCQCGRRGGLIVNALDSEASGPGSSSGLGHRFVFSGKTLYSHSASRNLGV